MSQVIVSVIEDTVRSTGIILESGSELYPSTQIITTLMDIDSYLDYNQLLINNTGIFEQHGAVGFDGLFVPYTTYYDHSGSLPRFTRPDNDSDITVEHLNPFNPLKIYGEQPRNTGVYETGSLNSGVYSYSSSQGSGTFNVLKFAEQGHNISLASTASIYASKDTIESGVHASTDYYDGDFEVRKRVELLDIKSIAHRAPLILSGPGYDIDGNPVPTGSGGGMHPQAYSNPSLWKTGPLDVRWDQSRAVWSAGTSTKVFLSKVTNTYNPSNFSYEVERSSSRDQFSRVGPTIRRDFNAADPIYDPEQIAYDADENNVGAYERLDYTGLEFPHYEAFILRQTTDDVGPSYYNIWSEDCSDCGHTSNPCESGTSTRNGDASAGKKILIENPLKQSLEAGDLCFTIKTGRTKNVNTGSFVGGSGVGASGYITTNSSGVAAFVVSNSGSGYIYGGFGLISSGICAGVTPSFTDGKLSSAVIVPSSGLPRSKTYQVSIYPLNSTAETESLDVHWIMQAEFKTTQVATYVGCDGGVLQTCSRKIQTQGMVSCEYCGTSTALINSF